jgi:hypothetical protein
VLSRSLTLLLSLCALAACSPLAAQDPPAHLASCTTDSAARFFLTEVQYLLAGTDSSARARRRALDVDSVPPADAELVTEDPVCLEASRAAGLHPPYPLAVVRAGERYLVHVPDKAHGVIMVFDLRLHRVAIEGDSR